jgi:hypothetical protein
MRDHIRIVGILNMIMGGLAALIGVTAFIVLSGVAGIVHLSTTSDVSDGWVAEPILVTIGIGIAIFFMILALPSLVGGWGLIQFRPWARPLMIVVSVFHLFHVPLGTALGVYGLWALLSTEAQQLFDSRQPVPIPSARAGPSV